MTAAEYVYVEMIHRLPPVAFRVNHKTAAHFPAAQFLCQFLGFGKQAACQLSILRLNIHNAFDVLFGYHQKMYRGLGIKIVEGKHFIVFVDFFARDFPGYNFAKNTVAHNSPELEKRR